MRIVSLLPSATDILVALGAERELVGVSHSCSGDWDHLPRLTSTWIDTGASSRAIDEQVTGASRPLYELDIAALEALAPDVIVSQSLCDVCAVPSGDVREAVRALGSQPALVDLAPAGLADVPACFTMVGEAIGRGEAAAQLAALWERTFAHFRGLHRARGLSAVFLDWLDPPFIAGHWVPEMIEHLGMKALMAEPRRPSFRTSWEEIAAARPDLVIVAACGLDAERARADAVPIDASVIQLDGHLHFSRPGPALLPSLAMLSDAVSEAAGSLRQRV